jgi:hypothetical protein
MIEKQAKKSKKHVFFLRWIRPEFGLEKMLFFVVFWLIFVVFNEIYWIFLQFLDGFFGFWIVSERRKTHILIVEPFPFVWGSISRHISQKNIVYEYHQSIKLGELPKYVFL